MIWIVKPQGCYSQYSQGHLQSPTIATKYKQFGWMKWPHNYPKNLLSGITRKFQSNRDTEHACNHSNSCCLLSACARCEREGEALRCCQKSHWLRLLWAACMGKRYNIIDLCIFLVWITCCCTVLLLCCAALSCLSVRCQCPPFTLQRYQLWICFSLHEKKDVWCESMWKVSRSMCETWQPCWKLSRL